MAEKLTSMQSQILDKNQAAIQALLGDPEKKERWKKMVPPADADAAAIADFKATSLDEIWIYTNGRVHFSLDGIARKVDDKVYLDLPPSDNLVA